MVLRGFRNIAFFVLALIVGAATLSFAKGDRNEILNQLGGAIDLHKEFPNLFVAREYRRLGPSQIPASEVYRVKSQLTAVIKHLIPHLLIKYEDGKKISLLTLAQERLQAIDPEAHLILAPGIVRTMLGFIYDRLHQEWRNNPDVKTNEVFNKILAQSSFDSSLILGVGSDFDLYVRSDRSYRAIEQVESIFTQTLQNEQKGKPADQWFQRLTTTVGEVHEVQSQLHRAISQGGSTLDMLAFDLTMGEFINPSRAPDTIDSFIRGEYDYLAPEFEESGTDNYLKQALRGLRPMVEIPFLNLKTSDVLLKDLSYPLADVEDYQRAAIQKQLVKIALNARLSAGNNRLFRQPDDPVVQKFLEVSNNMGRPLKIFVPIRPLWQRPKKELPAEYLMTVDQFKKKHTDQNHRLYHGVDDLGAVTSILRNGFYLSSSEQGVAVHGRGLYTSGRISVADGYAKKKNNDYLGYILSLRLAEDISHLRIVDFDKLQNSKFSANEGLSSDEWELMDALVNYYNVDIIINHYPLVQNLEAVRVDANNYELSHILLNYWLHGEIDSRSIRNLVTSLSTTNPESLLALIDRFLVEYSEESMASARRSELNPLLYLKRLNEFLSPSPKKVLSETQRKSKAFIALMEGLLEAHSMERLEALPQWPDLLKVLERWPGESSFAVSLLRAHRQLSDAEIMRSCNENIPLAEKIRINRIRFGVHDSRSAAFFALPENFKKLTNEEKEILKPLLTFEMTIPLLESLNFDEKLALAKKNGYWPEQWKIDSNRELNRFSNSTFFLLGDGFDAFRKLMTTRQYKELLLTFLERANKLANLQLVKRYIAHEDWTANEVSEFFSTKKMDAITLLKVMVVFRPKLSLSSSDLLQGRTLADSDRELFRPEVVEKKNWFSSVFNSVNWGKSARSTVAKKTSEDLNLAQLIALLEQHKWQELSSFIWDHTTREKELPLEKTSFEAISRFDDFLDPNPKKTNRFWGRPAVLDLLQILSLAENSIVNDTIEKRVAISEPLDGRMLSLLKSNNVEQRLIVYRRLYRAFKKGLIPRDPGQFMIDDANYEIRRNYQKIITEMEEQLEKESRASNRPSSKGACSKSLNKRAI
ncbi:MAG: hypothetical protein RJB66_539 [Pseudomonadota bacterium]|jgi:hypothetical protein